MRRTSPAESMRLSEFIKQTLIDISIGVHEASKEAPAGFSFDIETAKPAGNLTPHCLIEFDVAVTISSESKLGGRVGVGTLLAVGGTAADQTQQAHRVRFKVMRQHGSYKPED